MIKTAAILGAGAVGSYFIAGLKEKMGSNLWVIAEGARKERLMREGLEINHEKTVLNVKTPKEAHGVDLLIVAVKYGALAESLDAIAAVTGDDTIVMCVMNGVDGEEVIGHKIGMEHMVYSMMKISSEREGSSIVFNAEKTIGLFFGETNGERSERIDELEALFADSGVHYHICDNIVRDIWEKYALNIGTNLPQAIIGCGIGAYADSQYAKKLRSSLRDEVAAVAAAKGIEIAGEELETSVLSSMLPKARFSTLQDLDAGRHTEIDMFSGTLIRMGRELGVPTPYNEMAYAVIKALEEKNDGRFDY